LETLWEYLYYIGDTLGISVLYWGHSGNDLFLSKRHSAGYEMVVGVFLSLSQSALEILYGGVQASGFSTALIVLRYAQKVTNSQNSIYVTFMF
jgi:hypothetical protein